MSQAGYTPILIYGSGTASAVPLAANMTSSSAGAELALNYADGKLYYKDSGGVVQLLASTSGASGNVVGPASATNKAIATYDGTTGKLIQDNSGATITSGVITATDFSGPLNGTVGATTPNTGSFTSLTDSGNLTFTGTGNRITGDTSNATIANRLALQDSTTNSQTIFSVFPNGTGTTSQIQLYNGTDTTNYARFNIFTSSASITFSQTVRRHRHIPPNDLQHRR
jgi:hypothetical protein